MEYERGMSGKNNVILMAKGNHNVERGKNRANLIFHVFYFLQLFAFVNVGLAIWHSVTIHHPNCSEIKNAE